MIIVILLNLLTQSLESWTGLGNVHDRSFRDLSAAIEVQGLQSRRKLGSLKMLIC
jgi:hypothetical protein